MTAMSTTMPAPHLARDMVHLAQDKKGRLAECRLDYQGTRTDWKRNFVA
jgi:hypothetical protein